MRNNKFLMSDLDTLFREPIRALCVTLSLRLFYAVKEKTARSRTEGESHSSQSTGALMETRPSPSSSLSHLPARRRPIRKGSGAPVQLERAPLARRKATSGSQDEARENRNGELNRLENRRVLHRRRRGARVSRRNSLLTTLNASTGFLIAARRDILYYSTHRVLQNQRQT